MENVLYLALVLQYLFYLSLLDVVLRAHPVRG